MIDIHTIETILTIICCCMILFASPHPRFVWLAALLQLAYLAACI